MERLIVLVSRNSLFRIPNQLYTVFTDSTLKNPIHLWRKIKGEEKDYTLSVTMVESYLVYHRLSSEIFLVLCFHDCLCLCHYTSYCYKTSCRLE